MRNRSTAASGSRQSRETPGRSRGGLGAALDPRLGGSRRQGPTLADEAVKARLSFNLKLYLLSAVKAVGPVPEVGPRRGTRRTQAYPAADPCMLEEPIDGEAVALRVAVAVTGCARASRASLDSRHRRLWKGFCPF